VPKREVRPRGRQKTKDWRCPAICHGHVSYALAMVTRRMVAGIRGVGAGRAKRGLRSGLVVVVRPLDGDDAVY
jgi:hypothetical protein